MHFPRILQQQSTILRNSFSFIFYQKIIAQDLLISGLSLLTSGVDKEDFTSSPIFPETPIFIAELTEYSVW